MVAPGMGVKVATLPVIALVVLPALAHFLLKPSALQPSADAKAFVQLAGETA